MVVVAAVPILLLQCFLLHPTLEFCQAAASNEPSRRGDEVEFSTGDQPEFAMPLCGGALNVIEYLVSIGKVDPARVERGMDLPTTFQVVELVK
jgi:hypothetical protein